VCRLENHARDSQNKQLYLYGDPAYGLRPWLLSPYKGSNLSPEQLEFNRRMSRVRVTVEYGFQRIISICKFLDFKKNLKLYLQPIGKYYVIGALISNIHSIHYGNQTATYFEVDPPSLDRYLESALL
jgi:hypothetical protein